MIRILGGMDREVISLINQLHRERDIPLEDIAAAIEEALLAGYRWMAGADPDARVVFDPERASASIIGGSGGPAIQLSEADVAAAISGSDEAQELQTGTFGRTAVVAVRMTMRRRLAAIEQERILVKMRDQIGEALLGTVRMVAPRGRKTLVDLGHGVEGVIPAAEQIAGERHRAGAQIWVALVSVEPGTQGLEVILSRRSPDLVRGLIEHEIPEVAEGLVEVVRVVRRAGYRTKVGVRAEERGQDPVGAIIGPRGARVRAIMRELGGERIDVINLDHAPAKQLTRALQPATVRETHLDAERNEALIVVPDDELGRAIGPEGANARLAASLTGWRVLIRGASTHAAAPAADGEPSGLGCAAQRANGRRCPNAPEPGSTFCGLHSDGAPAPSAPS